MSTTSKKSKPCSTCSRLIRGGCVLSVSGMYIKKSLNFQVGWVILSHTMCRCDGMVDVADSKSADGDIVWVRVPPPAPCQKKPSCSASIGGFFLSESEIPAGSPIRYIRGSDLCRANEQAKAGRFCLSVFFYHPYASLSNQRTQEKNLRFIPFSVGNFWAKPTYCCSLEKSAQNIVFLIFRGILFSAFNSLVMIWQKKICIFYNFFLTISSQCGIHKSGDGRHPSV